jgi:hypothetical protein
VAPRGWSPRPWLVLVAGVFTVCVIALHILVAFIARFALVAGLPAGGGGLQDRGEGCGQGCVLRPRRVAGHLLVGRQPGVVHLVPDERDTHALGGVHLLAGA